MPMKGLRVWSLIILAVAAREHATDDAERRRRCVTEPADGFGIGRWVEGADDAARAISNIYGLDAATHPVVRWRWVPDNRSALARAAAAARRDRARAAARRFERRLRPHVRRAVRRARARVVPRALLLRRLDPVGAVQDGALAARAERGPRGQRAIRWQWGAFGAVEHACASGWNVSVFFLSTNKYSHAMRDWAAPDAP